MKQLLSGLMLTLGLFLILGSCKKDDPSGEQEINVTLKVNETYSYDLGSFGDEEGAIITRQAMHYQVSDLRRQANFSNVTYEYQPATDYTGTDEVTIRSERGWGGATTNDKIINTVIKFTIVH